jgi:hypothetical protein
VCQSDLKKDGIIELLSTFNTFGIFICLSPMSPQSGFIFYKHDQNEPILGTEKTIKRQHKTSLNFIDIKHE